MTPAPDKELLRQAMLLDGFKNWKPAVDVPELNRPRFRPAQLEGDGRVAAVMILLYAANTNHEANNAELETKLVLTKRHSRLANHAGQISFPGGRQDDGESLWETALRETYEEIGVGELPGSAGGNKENETLELFGQLNPVYIPPSDFTVNPYVAWHEGAPSFVRSEEEVDEIIEASVEQLLDPETLKFGDIQSNSGMHINVPYYQVGPHQVWGATAIILGELIERIRSARR